MLSVLNNFSLTLPFFYTPSFYLKKYFSILFFSFSFFSFFLNFFTLTDFNNLFFFLLLFFSLNFLAFFFSQHASLILFSFFFLYLGGYIIKDKFSWEILSSTSFFSILNQNKLFIFVFFSFLFSPVLPILFKFYSLLGLSFVVCSFLVSEYKGEFSTPFNLPKPFSFPKFSTEHILFCFEFYILSLFYFLINLTFDSCNPSTSSQETSFKEKKIKSFSTLLFSKKYLEKENIAKEKKFVLQSPIFLFPLICFFVSVLYLSIVFLKTGDFSIKVSELVQQVESFKLDFLEKFLKIFFFLAVSETFYSLYLNLYKPLSPHLISSILSCCFLIATFFLGSLFEETKTFIANSVVSIVQPFALFQKTKDKFSFDFPEISFFEYIPQFSLSLVLKLFFVVLHLFVLFFFFGQAPEFLFQESLLGIGSFCLLELI